MSLEGTHITAALRAAGAGWGLVATPAQIADMFNDAIEKYGQGLFVNANQVAALISECMMESDYFRTTEEYNKSGRYKPYIGRGFIQVTWRSNYLLFGEFCVEQGLLKDKNYFVTNPARLADLKWAAISGVWYFTRVLFADKPLTAYSDDIDAVGKAVNLGSPTHTKLPNGYQARRDAYKAVRALGSVIVPEIKTVRDETKEAIMAVGQSVKFWNNDNYNLKVGEQYVIIKKDTSDVSVVVGQNDGVQLVGVVELTNPGGYPVEGFWRVVDWAKDGKTTNKLNGIAIPSAKATLAKSGREVVQATYFGEIPKPSKAGRSMRLRFVIRVGELKVPAGEKAPPLPVINNIHFEGWKL